MKCPVCRKEKGGFSQNYHIKREVKGLHIYCTNEEKGCEWQGELNNIYNHLGSSGGCWFQEVRCSNECGKMIQRRYLTSHVKTECPHRKVNCQYCHDTGEHHFIEGLHTMMCPKLPLPCPNKCEVGSVPREGMEAHRKECPLEMIQCEYYSVGCKVRMARKEKEEHDNEKMKEHLMMTNHELMDTKTQLVAALNQITNLTAILIKSPNNHINIRSVHLDSMATMFKCGSQVCPVTIKMSGYSIKNKDGVEWYSDPFYSHNKGYKMCLCVYAAGHGDGEGTHLSVFLYLMKGPHDDELTWPLRGKFEIKLLNQISDSEHHSMIISYDDEMIDRVTKDDRLGNGWGYHEFISNGNLLITSTRTCQFLKNDCLFFQVTKHEETPWYSKLKIWPR